MIEPDYKIEECFEPENMRVYFSVYTLGANPQLIRRQFETLEEAKKINFMQVPEFSYTSWQSVLHTLVVLPIIIYKVF